MTLSSTSVDCACCDQCYRCPSISLSEWFDYLCFDQFSGFQMAQDIYQYPDTPIPCNNGDACLGLVYDSFRQGGHHPGRTEIYRAILRADEMFRDFAGYWPAPTYTCDEWPFKFGYMCGRIRLKDSKLVKLGKETFTALADLPVATTDITDDDEDGLLDTVTVYTPVVEGVSLDELALFFHVDDWPKRTDQCRNQIRPITVKVVDRGSGDEWQICWQSPGFAKPKLYVGMKQVCIDPNDPDTYPTQVSLYRKWYDESKAITVMRKRNHSCSCLSSCCGSGDSDDTPCYCCENMSACIVNAEAGLIDIDLRKGDCCAECAQKLCINYVAGDCVNDNAELMAHFVASLIGRDVCCADNPCMSHWQQDYISMNSRGTIQTPLSVIEKSNPFGTKRGGIDMYRYLRDRRAVRIIRI